MLDGEKTWISNGGIADVYVVFARTGEAPGARGISAFIVEAGTPGFEIAERIDVIAPHPLARLRFTGCRVAASQRIGAAGRGLQDRDAHARRVPHLGRGGRSRLCAARARRGAARARPRGACSTRPLADFQLTQAKLAQMATTVDSAALLTYRAAWQRDLGAQRDQEAAMAQAGRHRGRPAGDRCRASQMWGGLGVVSEQPVERLYREIRALRIYEGATEVQQLIIARELLKAVQA